MTKKAPSKPDPKPAQNTTPATPPKKKLSLEISDVSEVLERKISP